MDDFFNPDESNDEPQREQVVTTDDVDLNGVIEETESWKIFANHLSSKLQDDELNDVIFTFNDEKDDNKVTVKANRGLLSVLSPVFKSMFKNGMKESLNNDDNIPIKDIDSSSFKLFIEYFYGMNPKITPSNIGALSYLAQKYLVDGLQKICDSFVSKSLSMNNIILILESLLQYHQDKLFENCKIWMTEQTSTDMIINLFKSDTFINAHYMIVNVLLSGFGTVIDPTILWQCTLKWSKTKGDRDIIMKDDDDEKQVDLQYNKWMLIRKHFPFYRLSIDIICNKVLLLNILSPEMAMEVLSHKTNGYQRDLVKYCISHKPLYFPTAQKNEDIPIFELGKNKECFKIDIKKHTEYTVQYIGTERILFGNIPLQTMTKWKWEVYIDKYQDNPSTYFGIDGADNTSYPGRSSKNSYGMKADGNQMYFHSNNTYQYRYDEGISTRYQLLMYFDGPQRQFSIYGNGKLLYMFKNVNSNKFMYPSFKPRYKTVIYTIKNFSIVH